MPRIFRESKNTSLLFAAQKCFCLIQVRWMIYINSLRHHKCFYRDLSLCKIGKEVTHLVLSALNIFSRNFHGFSGERLHSGSYARTLFRAKFRGVAALVGLHPERLFVVDEGSGEHRALSLRQVFYAA